MCHVAEGGATSTPVGMSAFAEDCVSSHNAVRGLHQSTSSVTWDDELAQQAQLYLDSKVDQGEVPHSCPTAGQSCGYGENIFTIGGMDSTTPIPCAFAAFYWYRESVWSSYDYARALDQQSGTVGHFTQMVWRDTSTIGCARATHNNDWYILCQYQEPGNVVGSDAISTSNVRPLKDNNGDIPEKPQDLMPRCEDVYEASCQDLRNQCGESWGRDFGPFTYCPVTCNRC